MIVKIRACIFAATKIIVSPILVAMLLFLFCCDNAWGRIGETQDEMIQRLGEPMSKYPNICFFNIDGVRLKAQYTNGLCMREIFDVDSYTLRGIKGKDKVKKIEALLLDSSGGRTWEVVNLSDEALKWETTDGTLKAEIIDDDGGKLMITDKAAEQKNIQNAKERRRVDSKRGGVVFIVLLIPFCFIAFFVIRRRKSISIKTEKRLWGVSAIYVPLLLGSLVPIAGYFIPSLSNLLIGAAVIWHLLALVFAFND